MKHVRFVWTGCLGIAMAVACAEPVAEEHERTGQSLGWCAHALCAAGGPLDAFCDPCAYNVCNEDPYCCQSGWDATCVGEVTSICGQSCAAPPPPGPQTGTCSHAVCAVGGPLVSGCDSCTLQLCSQDPYCCSVVWDATCVGEVKSICMQACP